MQCAYVKKIIKTPFHFIGLDRDSREAPKSDIDSGPDRLPLFEDPLEALCHQQGGKRAAFKCPLARTVSPNGLSHSSKRYHPFVATLREYAAGERTSYEDSVLKRYYASYQPSHAAEAIVGFEQVPRAYANWPAHLYRLAPWRSLTAEEMDQHVREWSEPTLDTPPAGGTDLLLRENKR